MTKPKKKQINFTQDSILALMQEIYNELVEQRSTAIRIQNKMISMMKEPEDMTLIGPIIEKQQKIINDYNNYFKKNVSYLSLFSKFFITLCSSFVVDTATFDKMMRFFDFIIRDSDLDSLDPKRLYRLQGGLSERYFGVFLSLEKIKNLNLTTGHSKLI